MPSVQIKFRKTIFLISMALLLMGCDPLASDPTPRVIIVTHTPIPTTIRLAPTATETSIPPTDVPTQAPAENNPTEVAVVEVKSPTPAFCTESEGQIVDLSFTSKIARGKVRYRVFLPPCYV